MKFVAITPAKLNLSLAITGKKGGLHTLDMIVYPFEKYADKVEFCPDEKKAGFDIKITGGFDGLDETRFLRFANDKLQKIAEYFGVGGTLEIYKGVPLGAGLGGSSAAIACAIKAVREYLLEKGENTSLDVDFLLSLGSDVPCMVEGGACRVRGVGEIIEKLNYQGKIDVLEIIAKGGSDSGACYKLFDETKGGKYDLRNIPQTVDEAISLLRNDLFAPACALNKQIKAEYDFLKNQGYDKVFMSGSGSTVFAIKGFCK